MSAAYDPSPWHDFGTAVTGASAALAGLLVVAVSINLQPIITGQGLPQRVAGALTTFTTPLVFSVVLLIPAIGPTVLGCSLLAIGAACGLMLFVSFAPSYGSPQRTTLQWLTVTVIPAALLVVPILLAGLGLLVGGLGGLFWLPLAAIASVVGGLSHAWVLLVEILR